MSASVLEAPGRLHLYRELASVFTRHGGRLAAEKTNLKDWFSNETDKPHSQELAEDLEALGPTFVKLGQLLSTRADLLGEDYLRELERLQDGVEPVPYEQVEAMIAEEFGKSPQAIFETFSKTPLASASLGQVHRATLIDGRPVIVKVQRPAVRDRVEQELQVLAEVSETLENHSSRARKYRLVEIVEELSRSLRRELDYRMEARNLDRMASQLQDAQLVFVPRPYPEYTTTRVLTMDFVEGTKLPAAIDARSTLNGKTLADELFRVYLSQVLLEGTYHADPHPGNVLLTPDGRLCLLDLGMVGNMPASLQIVLARLLVAITEEDGDAAAETALDASGRTEHADETKFRRDISELLADYHRQPISEMQAGQLILHITQCAADNGILIPYELTMLAKTLMNLDEIGRRLDPQFNPTDSLERHTPIILEERLKRDFSRRFMLDSYLEARTFLKEGPRLANNILKKIENGTLVLGVDAVDERELLVSFQKIANRIGMSIVMGALILGASLLMGANVKGPTLLGYPALAVVSFFLAAGGGVWMVWNILRQDRSSGKELNQTLSS
ncbi:MAG: AarF/ABC1/UbiB kinase family protein [Vulcanimicrobiota bacterium]